MKKGCYSSSSSSLRLTFPTPSPIASPPRFGKLQLDGSYLICEGIAGEEGLALREEPLGDFEHLRIAVQENAGFLLKGSAEATIVLKKVWEDLLGEHILLTAQNIKSRPM